MRNNFELNIRHFLYSNRKVLPSKEIMFKFSLSPGPPFEEFYVNQKLTLTVSPEDLSDLPKVIHVRIREMISNTMSFTMLVDILDRDDDISLTGTSTFFLKLFDRRFSKAFRDEVPWSTARERAFVKAATIGREGLDDFVFSLCALENYREQTAQAWTVAQREACLAVDIADVYYDELSVYDALQDFQGQSIPRFVASLELDISPLGVDIPPRDPSAAFATFEPFIVKGILLERIEGFTLWDMPDRGVPRWQWQGLVDKARRMLDILDDNEILNMDVQPQNFIVAPLTDKPESADDYKVYMIDFGMCRFREENESNLVWSVAKNTYNGDGRLFYWMNIRLEREGFALRNDGFPGYRPWDPSLWDAM